VCLPAIWALSFLLVTYRLGVLPAESAASLKLLDKGVAKEALAALVLVQFPVELVSAVVAGRCVWRAHTGGIMNAAAASRTVQCVLEAGGEA
jgi:hypothetical protein